MYSREYPDSTSGSGDQDCVEEESGGKKRSGGERRVRKQGKARESEGKRGKKSWQTRSIIQSEGAGTAPAQENVFIYWRDGELKSIT